MGGIIVLVVVVMIVVIIAQAQAAKKRREGMAQLAAKLGLRFSQAKDRDLPRRYKFIDRLSQGSNRYALNVLFGDYRGHDILAFDYHYETKSTNSKGQTSTHHHYFSFFMLTLPRSFPELTIAKEGVFSKIAQAVGYDDIDFESHEFSRNYCVRCRDKKLAYDICNPQMIDYLLRNSDLTLEVERDVLADRKSVV